jgi:hypothetical protein
MQFVGWYVPWDVTNGAQNLVLRVLQFKKVAAANSQARQT